MLIRNLCTALGFVISALFLTACGGGGSTDSGNPPPTAACTALNSSDADTDGDKLSDCYEVFIGTSPADVDSDGDGLTDFDEVVTKAFDPTINNFQFNPRIADVPDITVVLQNIPDIEVAYTSTTNTSETIQVSRTNESATTLQDSQTQAQSTTEELSSTIGSSGGTSGFNISSDITYSQSIQNSMSWTQTQTQENRTALTQMKANTSEKGVTNKNGNISVLLKVRNRGYQTVTLSSMTITALQVDPRDPTRQKLVTGMDYDTSTSSFPTFDIGPNAQSNTLPFVAEMSLGKTFELLENSRNLSIEPTTWNIVDQDGRSYTHNLTNVDARAAQVIIDYAGFAGREIENHYTATVTDFGSNRISAATALTDILKVPYTVGTNSATYTGTNSGLLSVRNVVSDDAINSRWLLIHNFLDTDGITRLSKTYDSKVGAYDLDSIQIAKNEVLHLLYIVDEDGDGIGSREEFLNGTSALLADTDSDGLTDFQEIREGWDIPVTKTLTRMVFSNPTVSDADNDALLDGDELNKGTHPNKRDTDNDGVLDDRDTTLSIADMQEVAFLPLAQNLLNDSVINSNVGISGSFGHMLDRFGNVSAALNITQVADQLDVTGVYDIAPSNGATLILWIKVDPNLPANGWNLYEHEAPAEIRGVASQFFWLYPEGFWVSGDHGGRHFVFPNQNELFTSLPFADWHMLAMVSEEEIVNDGMKKFSVYYDGGLYSSVSHSATLVALTTQPWHFAGLTSYNVGLEQYRGGLDDIRFFDRTLDSEEIKLLYELVE